jgi:hypothetical protein
MDLIDNDEFKKLVSQRVPEQYLVKLFSPQLPLVFQLEFVLKLRIRRRYLQYFAIKIFIPSQRKIKDVIRHFVRFIGA